jgi:hypothetical protein
MGNLTDSLIAKAKKVQKVDVKELPGNTLRYKKSKFKTFSGKFKYENRKEYLKSLFILIKRPFGAFHLDLKQHTINGATAK